MKRFAVLLLCAALLLSLTACDSIIELIDRVDDYSDSESADLPDDEITGTANPPSSPDDDPPADDPPVADPPAENPPANDPPANDPPANDPPVEDPPAEEPDPTPAGVTAEHLRQIKEGFLMLVNLERQNCGVGTLTIDPVLDEAALLRSQEIVTLFSHTRPNGEDCFTAIDLSRYQHATLGENICYTSHIGTGYYTPDDAWVGSDAQIEAAYAWVFTLFKNSPGHYGNMIDADFEDCGIGVTCVIDEASGLPYFYVAHMFGATRG